MRAFDDDKKATPKPALGKKSRRTGNTARVRTDDSGSSNTSGIPVRGIPGTDNSSDLLTEGESAPSGGEPRNFDADSVPERAATDPAELIARRGPQSMALLFAPKGAHSILTDTLIEQFCAELTTCIFEELAAAACGISTNSLKHWVSLGRKVHEYLWYNANTYLNGTEYGQQKFDDSLNSVTPEDWQFYKLYTEREKTKAKSTRDDLDFIARARSKDWKAAAYRLKIRDRVKFADSPNVQITNSNTVSYESNNFTVIDYADYILGDDSIEVSSLPKINPPEDDESDGTAGVPAKI